MNYSIQVSPKNLSQKPSKAEMGKLIKTLTTALKLKSVSEFVDIVTSPKSWLWTGAELVGGFGDRNWKSQQVFALDFDCGVLPEEMVERSIKNELTPNFWYTTFSDTPELRKFRLVFIFDECIHSKQDAVNILKYLHQIFPEADKAAKDLSRKFFGGKAVFIISEIPISLKTTLEKIDLIVICNDHGKTRKLDRILKERGKHIQKSLKPNIKNDEEAIQKFRSTHQLEIPNWPEMSKNVKIFDDFVSGKWLYHPQIFGIASSLHWYKGGSKFMTETMKRHNLEGKTKYTDDKFKIPGYCAYMKYFPQNLETYSPYSEDHQYKDLVTAFTKPRRGVIITKEHRPSAKLEVVESAIDNVFKDFMSTNEPGISILKVPTGIGKTERLINLTGVAIGTPTHKLKEEIGKRMHSEIIISPNLPIFSSRKLNNRIGQLYARGCHHQANSLIKSVAKGQFDQPTMQDVKKAAIYLKDLANLRKISKETSLITTHERLFHTALPQGKLIFDEDPEKLLFEINMFTMNDLENMTNDTYIKKPSIKAILGEIKTLLEKSEPGIIYETPNKIKQAGLEEENEELLVVEVKNDLNGFLRSSYFMRDKKNKAYLRYIILNPIPENKQVLLMSASISEFIYDTYFGERIKRKVVFDKVESIGKIIQDTKFSFSRKSLDTKIPEEIKNQKDFKILTYKEFQKEFGEMSSKLYFGNCAGYDELKGKDLIVLGTPHINPIKYLFIAAALGFDVNSMNQKMRFQEAERNGFGFKFNTYDNEILQKIQMDLIETELIQAVGRARTLREDCEVRVFSNLPLVNTTEFVFNLKMN